jgi:hypothetical protein
MGKELVKESKTKKEEPKKSSSKEDSKKQQTKESSKQQTKESSKQQAKESSKQQKGKENSKTKNTKPESSDEENAKDKRNENTRNAGLTFDVNTRNRWNKAYLGQERFKVPVMESVEGSDGKKVKRQVKDDDGELVFEHLRVTGAEYAHSSNEQILCAHVASLACERLDKDSKTKAKLYELKHTLLSDTVRQDAELNFVFGHFLASFDPTCDYFSQLKIGKAKEVRDYVEKCLDNSSLHLTEDGLSFLYYLIQRNRVMLTECAFHMIALSGKKTVSEDAIMTAVKILYSRAPSLRDKLLMKFSAVHHDVKEAKALKKADKDSKPKNKGKSGSDSNKKSSSSKSSSSKQASKKKVVSDNDTDDSDESSADDTDDDN